MLFAIFSIDRPGSLELRQASGPSHIAYLQAYKSKLLLAGPVLDTEGRPCGTLLVIDVADRAEAEGFAEADPYTKASLFESTVIRPFRPVFRDGELEE